jgi:hypothetical protein
MASGIKTVNGVDLDDLFELAPSSQYSAREYAKEDVAGLPNGGTVEGDIFLVGGQSVWDRYLAANKGSTATGDTVGITVEMAERNQYGQLVNGPVDVLLQDYCAAKGSASAPTYSPNSANYTWTETDVSSITFRDIDTQYTKTASGNGFDVTYVLVSTNITGGSSESTLQFRSPATTFNSSTGQVILHMRCLGGEGTNGSDTYTVTAVVRADSDMGQGESFTHSVAVTVSWSNAGGGGPPL